jgi:hypothetical protein
MKRLQFKNFVYTVLILGFIIPTTLSCDKDDEFQITGTWNVDKVETYMGGDIMEEFTVVNDGTVTFNADGTGISTDSEGTESFSWSLSGNQLTISDVEETIVLTLTTMESKRMVGEFTETWEEITVKVVTTMSKS